MSLDRRSFLSNSLKSSIVALGGLAWPSWLPRVVFGPPDRSPRGDTLVVLFLRGAHDGLNIVTPYNEARYHELRPRIGIRRDKLLALDDHWGFNPGLLGFQRLWKEGKLAIVHGAGYAQPSFSHFTSMAYWHTAAPNSGD